MNSYGTTLTVRRQATNRYGDHTGDLVDTLHRGWDVAPVSSVEDIGNGRAQLTSRNAVSTTLIAYGGPAVHDIRAEDRVYLESDDRSVAPPWQVIGDPERWTNPGWGGPATGNGQSVVILQRVSG